MSNDIKDATIELILTDAISSYAKKSNKTISEVRDEMINSGAYDEIYDYDTGLWIQGPDYFIDYFLELEKVNENRD